MSQPAQTPRDKEMQRTANETRSRVVDAMTGKEYTPEEGGMKVAPKPNITHYMTNGCK